MKDLYDFGQTVYTTLSDIWKGFLRRYLKTKDMSKILELIHGQAKDSVCRIHLFGATITSWKVEGIENLFVSSKSALDGSKAIRGGIPVCFPSFGPWQFGPQHGFARSSSNWKVTEGPRTDSKSGDSTVTLTLEDDENSRSMWDNNKFRFDYVITLKNRELALDVKVTNRGDQELSLTFALHTYFNTTQVKDCRISGLKGLTFIDKTEGGAEKVEDREEVIVAEFTDRVYKNSPNSCQLRGVAGSSRTIKLSKENISDTVVWNPWSENAAKMADFGDDEFPKMICVEAVQHSTPILLKPNGTYVANHTLTVMD